jgi:hypothetical protein
VCRIKDQNERCYIFKNESKLVLDFPPIFAIFFAAQFIYTYILFVLVEDFQVKTLYYSFMNGQKIFRNTPQAKNKCIVRSFILFGYKLYSSTTTAGSASNHKQSIINPLSMEIGLQNRISHLTKKKYTAVRGRKEK